MNIRNFFSPTPVWSTEGATTAPATPAAPATTSTLTPDEQATLDKGWTPFVPDSTKNSTENLAAKAEYDKAVPKGHDPNKPLEAKAAPAAAPAPAAAAATTQLAYTDLVAPEGYTLDEGMGTEFIQLLNQHAGDPKVLANKLIELQVKAQSQLRESDSKAWDDVLAGWKKDAEKDAEIGGTNYSKVTSTAAQLVQRFGGEKLTQALELTGFGSHPEWLRFVHKLSSFVTEGSAIPTPTPKPQGDQRNPNNFYPGMDKK